MLGTQTLSVQQVIDVVFGAVDAWLSADVRRASRALRPATSGEQPMTLRSMMVCDQSRLRMTRRDELIGAGVMVVLNLAFTGPLMLSMPFWLMKGQRWRAQVAITGGTLVFLTVIAVVASSF